MAKFSGEREGETKGESVRKEEMLEERVEGEKKVKGRWRILHVGGAGGVCFAGTCYLWVHRSLFAGQ